MMGREWHYLCGYSEAQCGLPNAAALPSWKSDAARRAYALGYADRTALHLRLEVRRTDQLLRAHRGES